MILLTQFSSNVEGSHAAETPQILMASDNHAVLNKEMQQLFDSYVEDCMHCCDKDDTDASHFLISGDDGTQHWWII
jgi:hypothetical protein